MQTPRRTGIWRKIEIIGASYCVFYYTGALFPLMMMGDNDFLDDGERAKLRLLLLPVYAIILVLMAPHIRQVILAAVRNIPFFLFLMLPLISATWSITGSLTIRRAIALLMSTMLAILLTIRFTPRQQTLLIGITYTAIVVGSLGMSVAAPHLAYAPGESELRGLFVHKNVLGWISVLSVVFSLTMLRDPERRVRLFGWIATVIGFAGILGSQSVTSLLAANLAVVSAFALQAVAQKRGAARLVVQLILLQIAIAVLTVLTFNLQPLLLALGKDPTLTGRVQLWAEVDLWIAKNPILGYGFGAFWSDGNAAVWGIWEKIGWDAPHAHNGYRDLLLELGVVGTVLFVYIVVQAMKNGMGLLTREPGAGWLWCNLMIIVTLFLNLSETAFFSQQLFLTAIMTISFRASAPAASLPRHRRVAMAAV